MTYKQLSTLAQKAGFSICAPFDVSTVRFPGHVLSQFPWITRQTLELFPSCSTLEERAQRIQRCD